MKYGLYYKPASIYYDGQWEVNTIATYWNGSEWVYDGSQEWTTFQYIDPIEEIWYGVDADGANKTLSNSFPSVTHIQDSDSFLANNHEYINRMIGYDCDYYEYGLFGNANAVTNKQYTSVDLGCTQTPTSTNTYGVDKAGQYFHVTMKTRNGYVTNKVIQIPPAYRINYDTHGGSAVNPSSRVFTGYAQNVTSQVPVRDGYAFLGWYAAPNGQGNKYNANQPITLTSDITLHAAWKPLYKVTTSVTNGTITPTITGIDAGQSHSVNWNANAGYYVKSVTVDGNGLSSFGDESGSYTFSNIHENHSISVVCTPYHKVTTSIMNGTITPTDNKLKDGASKQVTWTANPGYYVKSVTIDGKAISSFPDEDGQKSFTNIMEDHTVQIVCTPYHKVVTDIVNGTITPTEKKLKDNSSYLVNYTPNDDYYVHHIVVDGVRLDAPQTEAHLKDYLFSGIMTDHTITVYCAKNPMISITKQIKDLDRVVNAKGDPIFQFKITGTDYLGHSRSYYRNISMDGKSEMGLTMKIPAGLYNIYELKDHQWELISVSGGSGSFGSAISDAYPTFGCATTYLADQLDGLDVSLTFVNDVSGYDKYTHNGEMINFLK